MVWLRVHMAAAACAHIRQRAVDAVRSRRAATPGALVGHSMVPTCTARRTAQVSTNARSTQRVHSWANEYAAQRICRCCNAWQHELDALHENSSRPSLGTSCMAQLVTFRPRPEWARPRWFVKRPPRLGGHAPSGRSR